MIKIDAHVHLWECQNGIVGGRPVVSVGNGKSDFGGEIRQMMPPYMEDGRNTAERLIANMDYAGVNGCVVTQEYIDGNQDAYLSQVKEKYPDRFKICALYEDYLTGPEEFFQKRNAGTGAERNFASNIFEGNFADDISNGNFVWDGIKICAGRLADQDLKKLLSLFLKAEQMGKFISIDMADGDAQVEDLKYLIEACPDLRIAIGHFGMVTTPGWQKQIELAKYPNVRIESGGLTWLFHKEFYPYPSAVEAILEAASICGMEKLMWGSDYPRTMTDITYRSAVRFLLESNRLSDADKKAFMGANAVEFYGFTGLEELTDIGNML